MQVIMRLKDDDSLRMSPTIMSKHHCEHMTTICVDCVESWATDSYIFFRQTAAGRHLRRLSMQRLRREHLGH